jgi:hypothetical protein
MHTIFLLAMFHEFFPKHLFGEKDGMKMKMVFGLKSYCADEKKKVHS